MPNNIAIICSLQELYDYAAPAVPASGTTPAVAATRMFSLNISTAVNRAKSGALSADESNLLSPWTWTVTDVQVWPSNGTKSVTGTFLKQPAPADPAAVLNLTTRLGNQLKVASDAELLWDPANPGAYLTDGSQSWPHYLAHASTYPAPLPPALNLVIFFTVPADALTGSTQLFVAPSFTVGPTTSSPDANGPQLTLPSNPWKYLSANVTCYQAPYAAPKPKLGSFDTNSMWITVAEQVGNEDWRTTLEQRAASAFDLGQLVIDALRTYIPSPDNDTPHAAPDPAQYETVRIIVVSILRDMVDSGLRYAPDGANLLRFVAAHLPDDTVTEDWLSAAEKVLGNVDKTVTPSAWNGRLKRIFSSAPGNPHPPQALTSPVPSSTSFATLVGWLDELQTKLAAGPMIAQIVFDAWDTSFNGDSSTSGTWAKISDAVQKELTTLSAPSQTLRQRMLQANMGGSDASLKTWLALTAPAAGATSAMDLTQVRLNLASILKDYFNTRLGLKASGDFAGRSPQSPALPPTMVASLTATCGARADKVSNSIYLGDVSFANPIPNPDGSRPPNPSITQTPHPIVVQVLEAVGQDSEDLLRSIAGVGVLVLETGSTNWSCLQTASLSVLDVTGQNAAQAQAVSFVPQRLSERNSLLQAAVSYNNQPLIAASPAALMGQDIPKQDPLPRDPKNQPRLLRYDPLPVGPTTQPTDPAFWARIPGLKFGKKYQFLAFGIRNSGALPRQLTASAAVPWQPVASSAFTPTVTPIEIDYKRRVAVGHVRYSGKSGNVAALSQESLPTIPDTVEPLAHRLYGAYIQASAPVPAPGAQPITMVVPQTPLLLLWNSADPGTAMYSFQVRPPSTDFQTWDRWLASMADPAAAPGTPALSYRTTRKAVFADFSWNAPKGIPTDQRDTYAAIRNSSATAMVNPMDITINDPAIAGFILSLQRISSTAGTVIQPIFIEIDPPAPLAAFNLGDGFAQVQTGAIRVDVSIGGPALTRGTTPRSFTVQVPQGQVWQLSIAPAISSDATETEKLETFMMADGGQFAGITQTFNGETYIAVDDPWVMLVEAAQTATLNPESLWRALQIGADSSGVNVTIDPAKADADWNLVRRVELLEQTWRWMGRPFNDTVFPTTGVTGDINTVNMPTAGDNEPSAAMGNALTWEMEAFADREDDANVKVARPDFGAEAPLPGVPRQIFTAPISTDLRAHYFRFGARAYSRYEGLPDFTAFGDGSGYVTAGISLGPAAAPDGQTPWKRFFWPSQFCDPVPLPPVATLIPSRLPKPQVMLCVPLTLPPPRAKQTDPPPVPSTSLLVIVEEPWFQIGGLAEELQIVFDSVSTAIDGTGTVTLAEIGPDPLLPLTSVLTPVSSPLIETQAGSPMGTTFDEASAAPLFANTCFHFDLTDLAAKLRVKSLDWYMAKVQFKRTLRADRIPDKNPQNLPTESPLTESTWVQFLPSSDHFTASGSLVQTHVDIITFTTTGAYTVSLTPALQPGPASMPAPGTVDVVPVFELWSLLMRDITDATGHASEVFVALGRGEGGALRPEDAPASQISSATHLYLIEVQKTAKAAASDRWIDDLLPIDPAHDAMYRAVRVSGRINRQL